MANGGATAALSPQVKTAWIHFFKKNSGSEQNAKLLEARIKASDTVIYVKKGDNGVLFLSTEAQAEKDKAIIKLDLRDGLDSEEAKALGIHIDSGVNKIAAQGWALKAGDEGFQEKTEDVSVLDNEEIVKYDQAIQEFADAKGWTYEQAQAAYYIDKTEFGRQDIKAQKDNCLASEKSLADATKGATTPEQFTAAVKTQLGITDDNNPILLNLALYIKDNNLDMSKSEDRAKAIAYIMTNASGSQWGETFQKDTLKLPNPIETKYSGQMDLTSIKAWATTAKEYGNQPAQPSAPSTPGTTAAGPATIDAPSAPAQAPSPEPAKPTTSPAKPAQAGETPKMQPVKPYSESGNEVFSAYRRLNLGGDIPEERFRLQPSIDFGYYIDGTKPDGGNSLTPTATATLPSTASIPPAPLPAVPEPAPMPRDQERAIVYARAQARKGYYNNAITRLERIPEGQRASQVNELILSMKKEKTTVIAARAIAPLSPQSAIDAYEKAYPGDTKPEYVKKEVAKLTVLVEKGKVVEQRQAEAAKRKEEAEAAKLERKEERNAAVAATLKNADSLANELEAKGQKKAAAYIRKNAIALRRAIDSDTTDARVSAYVKNLESAVKKGQVRLAAVRRQEEARDAKKVSTQEQSTSPLSIVPNGSGIPERQEEMPINPSLARNLPKERDADGVFSTLKIYSANIGTYYSKQEQTYLRANVIVDFMIRPDGSVKVNKITQRTGTKFSSSTDEKNLTFEDFTRSLTAYIESNFRFEPISGKDERVQEYPLVLNLR